MKTYDTKDIESFLKELRENQEKEIIKEIELNGKIYGISL